MSTPSDDYELGESDYACLQHLLRRGQPDGVHCSMAALDHLVAQGLVLRTGEGSLPGFARNTHYELTPQGRRAVTR